MSKATKIVAGTVGISALLSAGIILSFVFA